MSPKWIYNSECYSLDFSEQSVQNYFSCAYQLRCDELISLLAKQQVHNRMAYNFMTFKTSHLNIIQNIIFILFKHVFKTV